MKKLTVEQIDEALLKLMDDKPDYVYLPVEGESCNYHEGADPDCNGCIFGQALQALGVTKEELKDHDSEIMVLHLDFMPNLFVRPDRWMRIQKAQDRGKPWGELRKFLNN